MQPNQLFEVLCRAGVGLEGAVRVTDALRAKQASVLNTLVGKALDLSAPFAYGAAVLPPVAGYYAGGALAKAFDVGKDDITALQEQELIDELLHNASAIRRRKALRETKDKVEPSV